jgi:hypothetical protein
VSDIDTAVVDSLKAFDPKRPIREADIDLEFMSTRPNWTRSIRGSINIRSKIQNLAQVSDGIVPFG